MPVLELSIHLAKTRAMPWRKIAIDQRATLGDLHRAIQGACGWLGGHLFAFVASAKPFDVRGPNVAGSGYDDSAPPADEVPMSSVLRKKGDRIVYWYDFGDDWVHEVKVEAVKSTGRGRQLLGGRLAFPAEDCGGVPGYTRARKLVRARDAGDTLGEAALETLEWLGVWHPDEFELKEEAARFDLEDLPGLEAAPAPEGSLTLGDIVAGMQLSDEDLERCRAAMSAAEVFNGQPEGEGARLRLVRGAARAAVCARWSEVVKRSVPGSPKELPLFNDLLGLHLERLAEFAADDPKDAMELHFELVEGLQPELRKVHPADHIAPGLGEALARSIELAMAGERGVRPLRPLFNRIAAILLADEFDIVSHGVFNAARLNWNKAQRERIIQTMRGAFSGTQKDVILSNFLDEVRGSG